MKQKSDHGVFTTTAGRVGATVVELLTVLAIILVLATISLVGLQSARESTRKSSCSNNLRQWMIACGNYESRFRVFPAGLVLPRNDLGPIYSGALFAAPGPIMLHDLGFSTFSRDIPWSKLQNAESGASPPTFRCPSDSRAKSRQISYVGNAGLSAQIQNPNLPPNDASLYGAFEWSVGNSASSFSDGLSSTVFFSEKKVGSEHAVLNMHDEGIPSLDFSVLPTEEFEGAPSAFEPDGWLKLCNERSANVIGKWWTGQGHAWFFGVDAHYDHIATPNQNLSDCGIISPLPFTGVRTATSHHHSGVNTVFGDGRVAFVTNTIDLQTWRAIGTRAGGDNSSIAD